MRNILMRYEGKFCFGVEIKCEIFFFFFLGFCVSHKISLIVAVKAKPECCSEQNRNPEKKLVERASVHDFALKTTIVEG